MADSTFAQLEVALQADHPQANVVTTQEWEAWFSQWGRRMALTGSPLGAYELSLQLTDDAAIAQLNQQYRQIDAPTDVLSFAALEADMPMAEELLESEPLYLGDIIISLDTAARQAQAAGHSLRWETAWLAAHGFLHLLGWDHPDDEALVAMLTQQSKLLEIAGLKSEEVG
jgi:probable rRNA maturation factor